jgi:hypothetical protein
MKAAIIGGGGRVGSCAAYTNLHARVPGMKVGIRVMALSMLPEWLPAPTVEWNQESGEGNRSG